MRLEYSLSLSIYIYVCVCMYRYMQYYMYNIQRQHQAQGGYKTLTMGSVSFFGVVEFESLLDPKGLIEGPAESKSGSAFWAYRRG